VEPTEPVKRPEHEEQIIAPSASPAPPRDALSDDALQPAQSREPLQPDQREEIDLAPVLLQITDQELEFMKHVGPMISTPRAAKRFSNIYRLLRASMDPADLDRYVSADDGDGEYQAVLLLLALLVGFPQQAAVIFDELRTATDFTTWWEFVKDLQSRSGGAASAGSAQIKVGPAEVTKWNRLFRRIADLQSQQLAIPENLDLFRRWMPQVARFSFQTGHLIAARERDSASAAFGQNA
jgi:hypothetical protein